MRVVRTLSGVLVLSLALAGSGATWISTAQADDGQAQAPPPPPVPPFVRFAPADRPLVALTVDDVFTTSGAAALSQTLDVAESRGVHLTFFPTGGALEQHHNAGLDFVWQRAVADGDEIGNHTYTHRNLTKLSDDEIRAELTIDEQKLDDVLGPGAFHMYLMRPPGGAGGRGNGDPRVLGIVNSMGYSMIMWTIEPNGTRNEGQFIAKILRLARPGSIVLMHFTQISAAGIAQVIDGLRARGLEPTTVGGLFSP